MLSPFLAWNRGKVAVSKHVTLVEVEIFRLTKVLVFFLSANSVVDQQGYAIYFFAFKDIYHIIDLHFFFSN